MYICIPHYHAQAPWIRDCHRLAMEMLRDHIITLSSSPASKGGRKVHLHTIPHLSSIFVREGDERDYTSQDGGVEIKVNWHSCFIHIFFIIFTYGHAARLHTLPFHFICFLSLILLQGYNFDIYKVVGLCLSGSGVKDSMIFLPR